MRWTMTAAALVAILGTVGAFRGSAAQEVRDPDTQKADTSALEAHVTMLVGNVGSPDPRVRYAVREALIPMGTIAVAALNAAKRQHTDKRVRAFITRTVKAVKAKNRNSRTRRGRGGGTFDRSGGRGRGRRGGGFFDRSNDVDIDKVAMDANLTWDQMDKAFPILKSVRKDSSALMSELMEAEGWRAMRDREIREDLNAALLEAADEGAAKLAKFLKPEQMKQVKRHVSPMADMMKRWGESMNRRGDRRGGDRRGNERRPR